MTILLSVELNSAYRFSEPNIECHCNLIVVDS